MSYITPALQIIDGDEVKSIMEVAMSGRFAEGEKAKLFSNKLKSFLNVRSVSLCNSGSSANLLALSALTSDKLSKPLKKGDKVLTVAAGFPTTINPIFQLGMIPVFLDVELGTYAPCVDDIISAIEDDKQIRAVMIAHTLGNPYDIQKLVEYRLRNFSGMDDPDYFYIIEDCCDALGSKQHEVFVGKYGDLATLSFYPAHIISCGEGGAVFTNSPKLATIVESFRDWGRDCWCLPGCDNTCGKRFEYQMGNLPEGYDHKYIYSHIGYNMKMTDLQAAIGVAQMDKLETFITKRTLNHAFMNERFSALGLDEYFILPKRTRGSRPVWFGYCLTIRKCIDRNKLISFLEKNNVGTRLLFGGNIIKQPAYIGRKYEVHGNLDNSDKIMKDTFWVGCHPGMGVSEIEHIVSTFLTFIEEEEQA